MKESTATISRNNLAGPIRFSSAYLFGSTEFFPDLVSGSVTQLRVNLTQSWTLTFPGVFTCFYTATSDLDSRQYVPQGARNFSDDAGWAWNIGPGATRYNTMDAYIDNSDVCVELDDQNEFAETPLIALPPNHSPPGENKNLKVRVRFEMGAEDTNSTSPTQYCDVTVTAYGYVNGQLTQLGSVTQAPAERAGEGYVTSAKVALDFDMYQSMINAPTSPTHFRVKFWMNHYPGDGDRGVDVNHVRISTEYIVRGSTTVTIPGYSVQKPSTLTIPRHSTRNCVVQGAAQFGWNRAVTISAQWMPAGMTAQPVTLSAAEIANQTMRSIPITCDGGVAPGTYTIALRGVSEGWNVERYLGDITVTVPEPAFTLQDPSAVFLARGGTLPVPISVVPNNGFRGSVNMSALTPTEHRDLSTTFSPQPVSVTSDSPATTQANISLSATPVHFPPIHTYSYELRGAYASGSAFDSTLIGIKVLDYRLDYSAGAVVEVQRGGNASRQLQAFNTSQNGHTFASPVSLSATPTGANISNLIQASFSQGQLMPNATGTGTAASSVNVAVPGDVPPGDYLYDVRGTHGPDGAVRTAPLTVRVLGPEFSLQSPTPLAAEEGGSKASTLTASSLGGFSGPVSLSFSAPNGITVDFATNPVGVAAGGNGSSAVTFNIPVGTPPGAKTVTLTGRGTGYNNAPVEKSTSVTLNVTQLPAIACNTTVAGQLTVNDPAAVSWGGGTGGFVADRYRFTAGGGTPEPVSLSVVPTGTAGTPLNATIALMSASGNVILVANPAASNGASLRFTPAAGTSYVIEVTAGASSALPGGTGSYSLTACCGVGSQSGGGTSGLTVVPAGGTTNTSVPATGSIAANTTMGPPMGSPVAWWEIRKNNVVVATYLPPGSEQQYSPQLPRQNGWTLSYNSGTDSFLMRAPLGAALGADYAVRWSSPGQTFNSQSAFFEVAGAAPPPCDTNVPTPDFAVLASPESQPGNRGQSLSFTLTATPANGLLGTVSFGTVGGPTGFAPQLTPATPGTWDLTGSPVSRTLQLTVPANAVGGNTYTFTVPVTSSSTVLATKYITVQVTVPKGASIEHDVTAPITVVRGESRTVPVRVRAVNGTAGTATLSAVANPATGCPTFSFAPPSVTLNGSDIPQPSTLQMVTGTSTTAGNFTVNLAGSLTGGTVVPSAPITVRVQDFTPVLSAGTLSINRFATGTVDVTVNATNGFSGPVTLQPPTTGLPAGVTVTPASANLPTGTGTQRFTIQVDASTPGIYPLTFVATHTTAGGTAIQRQAALQLTVPEPGFSLMASPASIEMLQGETKTVTLPFTAQNNFRGSIAAEYPLVSVGTPVKNGDGITLSLSPNPVQFSAASPGPANPTTLTIAATTEAQNGRYEVRVKGKAPSYPGGPEKFAEQVVAVRVKLLPPDVPSPVTACDGPGLVRISWMVTRRAERYVVKRADTAAGQYVVVADNIADTLYDDLTAQPGTTYFYKVQAVNETAASAESSPAVSGKAYAAEAIECGGIANGELTASDGNASVPNRTGHKADRYRIRLQQGVPVSVALRSPSFDTVVSLLDVCGSLLTENDDAVGSDSQFTYTPGATGYYTIEVTSHGVLALPATPALTYQLIVCCGANAPPSGNPVVVAGTSPNFIPATTTAAVAPTDALWEIRRPGDGTVIASSSTSNGLPGPTGWTLSFAAGGPLFAGPQFSVGVPAVASPAQAYRIRYKQDAATFYTALLDVIPTVVIARGGTGTVPAKNTTDPVGSGITWEIRRPGDNQIIATNAAANGWSVALSYQFNANLSVGVSPMAAVADGYQVRYKQVVGPNNAGPVYNGTFNVACSLGDVPCAIPVLLNHTLDKKEVVGGTDTANATILLSGAAANDAVVNLTTELAPGFSLPPGAVSLDEFLPLVRTRILDSRNSLTYAIGTRPVAAMVKVLITARYHDVAKTAALTIFPDPAVSQIGGTGGVAPSALSSSQPSVAVSPPLLKTGRDRVPENVRQSETRPRTKPVPQAVPTGASTGNGTVTPVETATDKPSAATETRKTASPATLRISGLRLGAATTTPGGRSEANSAPATGATPVTGVVPAAVAAAAVPLNGSACGPMDVAFVIDESPSMNGAINSVKQGILPLLDVIQRQSGGDYRLALVAFDSAEYSERGYGLDNIRVLEEFHAANGEAFRTKLTGIPFETQFIGVNEASDLAMSAVLGTLVRNDRLQMDRPFTTRFRPDARKVIFVVTDAPPTAGKYYGGLHAEPIPAQLRMLAHKVAQSAAEQDVRIISIFVPTGIDPNATLPPSSQVYFDGIRSIMRDYADTTRGFFHEVEQDGAGVSQVMVETLAMCAEYRRGASRVVVPVTDSSRTAYAAKTITAFGQGVELQEAARFPLTGVVRGKLENIHITRRGRMTRLGSSDFDVQWGVRTPAVPLEKTDFSPVTTVNNAVPKPFLYEAAWFPSEVLLLETFRAAIRDEVPAIDLTLVDYLSSVCPPMTVTDEPHGTAATLPQTPSSLALKIRPRYTGDLAADAGAFDNPRVKVGGSLDITLVPDALSATFLAATNSLVWQVLLDGVEIASSAQGNANGWSVTADATAFRGVLVQVPANALIANGYEVRAKLGTAGTSGARVGLGLIDVVDAGGNPASFGVVPAAPSITVPTGDVKTLQVEVQGFNWQGVAPGIKKQVDLWLADLPVGVTYTFAPAGVPELLPDGTPNPAIPVADRLKSVLTITIDYSLYSRTEKRYPLRVVGIWRDTIATAPLELVIPGRTDGQKLTVTTVLPNWYLRPGESASTEVQFAPSAGWSALLTLSAQVEPGGGSFLDATALKQFQVAIAPKTVRIPASGSLPGQPPLPAKATLQMGVDPRLAADPAAVNVRVSADWANGQDKWMTPLTFPLYSDPSLRLDVGGVSTDHAAQGFTPATNGTAAGAVWSYGAMPAGTLVGSDAAAKVAAFAKYTATVSLTTGVVGWGTPARPFSTPYVVGNVSVPPVTKSYYSSVTHAPGLIALHPGQAGEFSVLRFTSPAAGRYRIAGRWQALDAASVDVHILHNGVEIAGSSITAASAAAPPAPFALTRDLAAGDVVDFLVGYGTGTSPTYNHDSTGLGVTISGGPVYPVNGAGDATWRPDDFYVGGTPLANGGVLVGGQGSPWLSPEEATRLGTGRYSSDPLAPASTIVAGESFTYFLPAPALPYQPHALSLYFAELQKSLAGGRKFNVFVNGDAVLTNFDVLALNGVGTGSTVVLDNNTRRMTVRVPVSSPAPTPVPAPADVVWGDDEIAAAGFSASSPPLEDGWVWAKPDWAPTPAFGTKAHYSPLVGGVHRHSFSNMTKKPTFINTDVIYVYVWLDPVETPSEILLEFKEAAGNAEHRAYWGENRIATGGDETDGRRYMGSLPAAGKWVRLQVPVSAVGLAGRTLDGVAFYLYGGRAAWDRMGKGFDPQSAAVRFESVTDRAMVQGMKLYTGDAYPALAPAVLTARAIDGTKIRLSWAVPAGQPSTTYTLRRGTTSGGPYGTVVQTLTDNTGQTGFNFDNTGLTTGTTYYYVVAATKSLTTAAGGTELATAPSNEASATPRTDGPEAVQNLAAVGENNAVQLSWNAVAGTGVTYRIQRSVGNNVTWNTLPGSVSGASSFRDTVTEAGPPVKPLQNGVRYFYRVVAVASNGVEGPYSNEANAIPTRPGLFVDAGAGTDHGDTVKEVRWLADPYFTTHVSEMQGLTEEPFGGPGGPPDGTPETTPTIAGTTNQGLYLNIRAGQWIFGPNSAQSGIFSYVLTAPGGAGKAHTVRLHFADHKRRRSGDSEQNQVLRKFHVDVNTVRVLTGFNIADAAKALQVENAPADGTFTAVVKTFEAVSDPQGRITLTFTPENSSYPNEARVAAIEVLSGITNVAALPNLLCGETKTGTLNDGTLTGPEDDYSLNNTAGDAPFYADLYEVPANTAAVGKALTIRLKTPQNGSFDAFLYLIRVNSDGTRTVVAQNDDARETAEYWHSKIVYPIADAAAAGATYVVEVTSSPTRAPGIGTYQLSLACADASDGDGGGDIQAPEAATSLTAERVSAPQTGRMSHVRLRWVPSTTGGARYKIARQEVSATGVGSGFAVVGQVGVGATGFEDKSLPGRASDVTPPAEARYEYKVLAYRVVQVNNQPTETATNPSNTARTNTFAVPPTTAVMSPRDGFWSSAVSHTVRVAASASDHATVAGVQLRITQGGVVTMGGTSATPDPRTNIFRIDWTAPSSPGSYTIEAVVTDTNGLQSVSAPVTVQIGNAAKSPTPVIEQVGVFETGPRIFRITSAMPGAAIWYKIFPAGTTGVTSWGPNGQDPSVRRYTGPFTLTQNGTIYAFATRSPLARSDDSWLAVDLQGGNTAVSKGDNRPVMGPVQGALVLTKDSGGGTYAGGQLTLETVTGVGKITGTVSGSSVAGWSLAYRRADAATPNNSMVPLDGEQGGWMPVSSGVTPPPDGVLGEFDTTVLQNGLYEIRLRVFDLAPNVAPVDTYRTVLVDGGQKTGPMTLSLTDLSLPAPGFPITVTRSYDSRDKRMGDVGIGWRLSLNDARVEKSGTGAVLQTVGTPTGRTTRIGDSWREVYNPLAMQYTILNDPGHLVTVTVPGGSVYGFYATLDPDSTSVYDFDSDMFYEFYGNARLVFRPIPGTQAEREGARLVRNPSEGDQEVVVQGVTDYRRGTVGDGIGLGGQLRTIRLLDANTGGVFDADRFVLTTRSGTKYYLNAANEAQTTVEAVEDRNGNYVEYNAPSGRAAVNGVQPTYITSYHQTVQGPKPTRRVVMERDAGGRVQRVRVVDLSTGQSGTDSSTSVIYNVNAAGQLASVTDRNGSVTSYDYDAQNNLTTIGAPSVPADASTGQVAITPRTTYRYDNKGRLSATENGSVSGAVVSATVMAYFPEERRTVITTSTGDQTLMSYDDLGNVTGGANYLREWQHNPSSPSNPILTTTRVIRSDAHYGFEESGDDIDRYRFGSLKNQDTAQLSVDPVTGSVKTRTVFYEYDRNVNDSAFGDLLRVTDPRDTRTRAQALAIPATRTEYNSFGQVTKVFKAMPWDPKSSEDAPYETGQLLREVEVTTNTYDTKGNLLHTQDALRNVTVYSDGDDLNPDGTTSRVRDATGRENVLTYDDQGNVKGRKDAKGNLTTFTYDIHGRKKTETLVRTVKDADGVNTSEALKTEFTYDNEGRIIKVIRPEFGASPESDLSQTVYNALGKISKSVDTGGNATQHIYDGFGRQSKTTYPTGLVTETLYDDYGRAYATIDVDGSATTIEWDSLGRVVRNYRYQPGKFTRTNTRAGQYDADFIPAYYSVRETKYDDGGRIVASIDPRANLADTNTERKTTYEYDLAGNQTKSVTPANIVIETLYDAANRQVSTIDGRGNKSFTLYNDNGEPYQSQPTVNGVSGQQPKLYSTSFFDALGRPVREVQSGTNDHTINSPANGSFLKQRLYAYDEVGRIASVTEVADEKDSRLNPVTKYEYDEVGNKISQTDGEGRTTRFGYDAGGRLVWRKLPLGQIERKFYNSDGTLNLVKDLNGRWVRYRYYRSTDASNNKLASMTPLRQAPVSLIDASQDISAWPDDNDANTWDEPGKTFDYYRSGINAGKQKSLTYGSVLTEYAYDNLGRLQTLTTIQSSGLARIVAYTYDLWDNKTSVTVTVQKQNAADGVWVGIGTERRTEYTYDTSNRIKTVKHWNKAQTSFLTTTYAYNGNGSVDSVTRQLFTGGNLVTRYGYTATNTLLWMTHQRTDGEANLGAAKAYRYELDALGRRTGVWDSTGLILDVTGVPQPTSSPNIKYVLDRLGRLTEEFRRTDSGSAQGFTRFGYDLVSNRLSQEFIAGTNPNATPQWSILFQYDHNDRLLTKVKTGGVDAGTTAYTYFENGATRTQTEPDGKHLAFSYTFEERLFGLREYQGSNPAAVREVEYSYDGEGNRLSLVDSGGGGNNAPPKHIEYIVDTQQPYAEVIAEWEMDVAGQNWQETAWYDIGLDRLLMNRFNKYYYYIHDGLGSSTGLVDVNTGAATNSYAYDVFGMPTAGANNTVANSFLFNGQQFDSVENLYFLRARYYDPSRGAFISVDPYLGEDTEPRSLHRYLYANSDPVNYYDPTGRSFIGNTFATMGIMAHLASSNFALLSGGKGKAEDYLLAAAYGAEIGLALSLAEVDGKLLEVFASGMLNAVYSLAAASFVQYSEHIENKSKNMYLEPAKVYMTLIGGFASSALSSAIPLKLKGVSEDANKFFISAGVSVINDVTKYSLQNAGRGITWGSDEYWTEVFQVTINAVVSGTFSALKKGYEPPKGSGPNPWDICKHVTQEQAGRILTDTLVKFGSNTYKMINKLIFKNNKDDFPATP